MFTGLTPEICARAWDALQPSIRYAYEQGILRDYTGTIVLLNPADPAGEPLFMAHLGAEPGDFYAYATAKARLALRTGVDTTRLRTDLPHLYQPGEKIRLPACSPCSPGEPDQSPALEPNPLLPMPTSLSSLCFVYPPRLS